MKYILVVDGESNGRLFGGLQSSEHSPDEIGTVHGCYSACV